MICIDVQARGGGGGGEGGGGAQTSLEDLELVVRCGICLTVKDDYRLLACLHSFCVECLRTQARTAAADGKPFACAKCRGAHAGGLTPEKVEGLVRDFERTRLRDELASRTAGGKSGGAHTTKCEDDGDEATAMCGVCAKFMCADCAKVHKKHKATAGHAVVPLGAECAAGGKGAFKRDVKCAVHALPLDYFCKECDAPLCQTCAIIRHTPPGAPTHDFGGVAEQV